MQQQTAEGYLWTTKIMDPNYFILALSAVSNINAVDGLHEA